MNIKSYLKKNSFLERYARIIRSLIPYRLRKLCPEFWRFYNLLFVLENESLEIVRDYQFKKLKELVESAYEKSSFYRRKYDAAKFHPSQLLSLADLNKIPTLTKEEVRTNSSGLILSSHSKEDLILGPTSGTTGKALALYFDQNVEAREWASICYQWSRVGYKPGDGRIELRGFIDRDVDYIFMPDDKVLRINLVKLSDQNIAAIIKKINEVGYKFIHGYPSAVFKFANIVCKNKITYNPQAIMMASEVLYDWQMSIIDEVFNCQKIIHYGMAERVALGAWSVDRRYYFIPAYGIVEHDNSNNELIGTSLINDVMPLIRYRVTDDILHFSPQPLKGKTLFPVIEQINGRDEDTTYDFQGRMVPPAIVTFPFKYLKYIESAKIVQKAIGHIELICETKLASNSPPLQSEIDGVIVNLRKLYGEETQFKVTITDKIPLNASGKFRWIECKIND